MTDLGLSNGYFCVVEQDDTFKFLIDYGSLEKPWGKGFLDGRLFPQTFAGAVYNVCIRGCKRYPWRTYVFAFKVDQIGPGGCSALQGWMQCTAGAVAVHCGGGCSALRGRLQCTASEMGKTGTEIVSPILDKRKGRRDTPHMGHSSPH